MIHIPLSDRRDQPPSYDANKICINASSLSFNDKPPPSYEETIARTTNI